MKKLLILLTLISCGEHTLITNPAIDLDYKKDSDDKPSSVKQSKVVVCNMQSFNNRCTNIQAPRVLFPYEFFSPNCYNQYLTCINN